MEVVEAVVLHVLVLVRMDVEVVVLHVLEAVATMLAAALVKTKSYFWMMLKPNSDKRKIQF
jgi:hypothetical protein